MEPQEAYNKWYEVMLERFEHFKHDAELTVVEARNSYDNLLENDSQADPCSEEILGQFRQAISDFEEQHVQEDISA